MNTRDTVVNNIKQMIKANPTLTHFKHGKSYSLGAGRSYVLPNSVFILDDGSVLIAATTINSRQDLLVTRADKSVADIFQGYGLLGRGEESSVVKLGLLYTANFSSFEAVFLKFKIGNPAKDAAKEAENNRAIYGIGKHFPHPRKKTMHPIVGKYIEGKSLYHYLSDETISRDQKLALIVRAIETLMTFQKKGYTHSDANLSNFICNYKVYDGSLHDQTALLHLIDFEDVKPHKDETIHAGFVSKMLLFVHKQYAEADIKQLAADLCAQTISLEKAATFLRKRYTLNLSSLLTPSALEFEEKQSPRAILIKKIIHDGISPSPTPSGAMKPEPVNEAKVMEDNVKLSQFKGSFVSTLSQNKPEPFIKDKIMSLSLLH